jgi:hypothetical protein
MIEGVVDLHRVKAAGIEPEQLFGGDLFRIEMAFPFLVSEPAGAGIYSHGSPPQPDEEPLTLMYTDKKPC